MLRARTPRALAATLIVALASAVLSAAVLYWLLVPLPLPTLAAGLVRHARLISERGDTFSLRRLFTYWVLAPNATGYLVVLGFAACVTVPALRPPADTPLSRLALLTALAFGLLCWWAGFVRPATAYNVQLLAPLFFFLLYDWSLSAGARARLAGVRPAAGFSGLCARARADRALRASRRLTGNGASAARRARAAPRPGEAGADARRVDARA
jgi:hypothetical protein